MRRSTLTVFLLVALCTVTTVSWHPRVTLWGCQSDIHAQKWKFDQDGHIHPINLPNKCLQITDEGTWMITACGGNPQNFVYDVNSKQIINKKKSYLDGIYDRVHIIKPNAKYLSAETTCLTATVSDAQKTSYGTMPLFQPCSQDQNQKWIVNTTTGTISPIAFPTLCADFVSRWQCDDPNSLIAGLPFCNHNLTNQQRAIDLVARMTPEEKMAQMMHVAPAITRLGIAWYDYWSEALHGVLARFDTVTMFPQVIGLGATFNQTLYKAIAKVISTEARALANQEIAGLTYWSPNININRDPRWGRGQETPGEDPFLTSRYAVNFVQGMQEGDPNFTKVVATCKHFAAYSLEYWNGVRRNGFDAKVDQQDLEETYLPAFKACVTEGKAKSVMCSYNAVNGVPACASEFLLQTKLRDQWGFNGYVVSDCDAVRNVYDAHHYVNTTYGACAVSLKAGTDLDCGDFYKHLPEAYNRGMITDNDLNSAVTRLFTERFALGMFDRSLNPYEKIPLSAINTPESQRLSLQAARESIVLLKNHHNALPLDRTKIRSIAVIGPNANDTNVMWGNYYGRAPFTVTVLDGIRKSFPGQVNYAFGCSVTGNDTTGFDAAVKVATISDVIIMVIGINQNVEAELKDRYNITLPGMQSQLTRAILKAADSKPVVIVLVNGSPLDITDLRDDQRVSAIVEAWYGGQSGGTAIADVLFGDYNPGAVLPVTFYPQNYVNMIPLTDMNMRKYPGRTYRYLQIEPVFKFGFGLSYTSFIIGLLNPTLEMYRPVKISLQLLVKNIGSRDGDYVALVFAKSENDQYTSPYGTLIAFERVHVRASEKRLLELQLTDQSFERFHAGKLVTSAANFTITITGTQNSNTVEMMTLVV
jgi:beta-glucosidase-like glycosyl hydrolase